MKRSKKKAANRFQEAEKLTKTKITFHTDPAEASPTLIAMLLSSLAHANGLAKKMPDSSFPIHIMVEMGDKKMCGTIEPATDAEPIGINFTGAVH